MNIILINDSKDDNARVRQETRYANLFPQTNISFIGIDSSLGINTTLEAAGNLIDVLDASEGKQGVIAVNVAPRGQIKEDGTNGSNFSFFWYKETLIVSTIKGYNLTFIKKFKLTDYINVLDTEDVLKFAANSELITNNQKDYINTSQFRSFDFQPRVAKWIFDGKNIPFTKTPINKFPDAPNSIWFIDSFGNIKTTLLRENLFTLEDRHQTQKAIRHHEQGRRVEGSLSAKRVKTTLGTFPFYNRLKDVPDGETAIYAGSSGIDDKRFLEIATQNTSGSAQNTLKLKVGDKIEILE